VTALQPALRLALAAAAALLPATAALAQSGGWFYFDPVRLEVELRLDGYSNSSDPAGPGPSQRSQTLELEERISIGQDYIFVDPRIATLGVDVEPVFRQGVETQNGDSDRKRGSDLDYDIKLAVLRGSRAPVEFYLDTFHESGSNDLAFGSRNENDVQSTRMQAVWKNVWFPLSFTARSSSLLQEFTRADGLGSLRDEDRQFYSIKGGSSKLRLDLSSERVDDKVNDRDYDMNRASLLHYLRWGRGSRLSSSLRGYERTGQGGFRQFDWLERLSIYHTDNLDSQATYQYVSQSAETDSETQEGEWELRHRLYQNLESELRLWGRGEETDLIDRDEYEGGIRSRYNKQFPFGLVTAGVYGNYRFTDRESLSDLAEVIDERHTARYVDPIILGQQLVDESTIRVAAEDGFLYEENLDYEIFPVGGTYTELRIVPSGRIQPGDLLLVSYFYEPQPSAEYHTVSTGYNLSLNYRWLRFYHNSYANRYDLVSGNGLPPDQGNRATGVEVTLNREFSGMRFRMETRKLKNGGFESDTLALNQTLNFTLRRNLSLSLSGNQIFNETQGVVTQDPLQPPELQDPRTSSDFYSLDALLDWGPRPNLSVQPRLGVWKRLDEAAEGAGNNSDRLYMSAQVRVSWLVRALAIDFFYDYNTSDVDGTDRQGNRLMLTVRRRFR
jgi:hypothetical protein